MTVNLAIPNVLASESGAPGGDQSWEVALEIVQSSITIPKVLNGMIRNTWSGVWEVRDFMRALGFVGVNVRCLLRAAEISVGQEEPDAKDVERAVQFLGVRASAVIVAVNFVCQSVLKKNPPEKLWVELLREMMNLVEIGYSFGSKAEGIGVEGGMIMGFVRNGGLAILLAKFPKEYAECFQKSRGVDNPRLVLERFGCESYQVGAMMLQQLGFGADIAVASALACGKLHQDLIDVPEHVLNWKAAYLWVECLRNGLSSPRDPHSRTCFQGLTPPLPGQPTSPSLGALYAQITQVRRKESKWTWNLPKADYQATQNEMAARKSGKSTPPKSTGNTYSISQGTMIIEKR